MSKIRKPRYRKTAGLPPGSLVYIGDRKREEVRIELISYNKSDYSQEIVKNVEDLKKITERDHISLVDVLGLNQIDIIEKIGRVAEIHHMILEDIIDTSHPIKIDFHEEHIFLILKLLSYDEKTKSVNTEHIGLVLGKSYVIIFQEIEDDTFKAVKERIAAKKGRISGYGADYLFYALIDLVVDSYLHELDKISDDIEIIEDELLLNPDPEILKKIHRMKSTLISLKKSFKPLAEVVNAIELEDTKLIRKETYLYIKDLSDHIAHVLDALEANREMLTAIVDMYMSATSYKMNEVMKVLTVIATIFIPLTFIAGVYGMNFRFMPELRWQWGYPVIMAFMLGVGLYMLYYFKRKGWF